MSNFDFGVDSPLNYEQKCCCTLVLDVSGSMSGSPIKELNVGLQEFCNNILNDSTTANRLEVGLIEFSDIITTRREPTLLSYEGLPTLTVRGTTRLVDGVRQGIATTRTRKNYYKQSGQPFYRPWVILITDGEPDGNQDTAGLAMEINDAVNKKDFFFFAIGVEGANMGMLNSISHHSMPPAKLQGLKFSEFFKWLSASMSSVANSKDGDKVSFPNPALWMQGFSI
jgi:uncharacterized protein YegL